MQLVERSALVTYTAAQMFALVNDVARYPEFLPWCIGARVEEVSAGERVASLKMARGVLRTEFTTRNTLKQDEQIQMKLLHGPFRDLTGEWRFEPIGTRGSRVYFRVEFEFKNRLTATAFNSDVRSPVRHHHRRLRAARTGDLLLGSIRPSVRHVNEAPLHIEVVYAEPQRAIVKVYRLDPGSRVADALRLAALDPDFAGVDLENSTSAYLAG